MIEQEILKDLIPATIQSECEKQVKDLIGGARIEKILNPQQYQAVGELTKQVRASIKTLEEQEKVFTKPLNDKKTIIINYFKGLKGLLEGLKDNLDRNLLSWKQEADRKLLEEQKARDEEARRERARILAEADKKRQQEEALRRQQEEAEQRARDATNTEERAKAEAEAKKAEAQAQKAAIEAQSKEEVAALVTTANVDRSTSIIKGVSHKEIWIAKIINKELFIEHCIKTGQSAYIVIDEKMLSDIATKMRGEFKAPGIEFTKDYKTTGRAAK